MPPRSPRPRPAVEALAYPWRAVTALALIYLSIVLQWSWPWGVLFIFWTLPALRAGEVHLIDRIGSREHPWLFAFILFTWILLSFLLIWIDLAHFMSGNSLSGGTR